MFRKFFQRWRPQKGVLPEVVPDIPVPIAPPPPVYPPENLVCEYEISQTANGNYTVRRLENEDNDFPEAWMTYGYQANEWSSDFGGSYDTKWVKTQYFPTLGYAREAVIEDNRVMLQVLRDEKNAKNFPKIIETVGPRK
jgi:hypothetical protein